MSVIHNLNDSFDFKESLEIVDLTKGHCNEQKRFKHGPPHDARVSVVIDCRGENKTTGTTCKDKKIVQIAFRITKRLQMKSSKKLGKMTAKTVSKKFENNDRSITFS